MKNIKQHSLSSREAASLIVHPLTALKNAGHNLNEPHRDDHYLLLIALEGHFHFKLDFEDVRLRAPFVLCIEPGQVHQIVGMDKGKGWALGIEEYVLEPEFLSFLETSLVPHRTLKKGSQHIDRILALTNSIQQASDTVYSNKAVLFLINSFFCLLFEDTAARSPKTDSKEKRKYVIEQDFSRLLKRNFKTWKKPSQYASALSISTSHLNDTIKEVTGRSVSEHIRQRNGTEAKRLLYLTDLEVQEIAFRLGYNDHVYFGKLFKKISGTTPLAFRKQFRD